MIDFIGVYKREIIIAVLLIWNFILVWITFNCAGCEGCKKMEIKNDIEEGLFKKYLEKEAECECLKEKINILNFEIQKLENKCQIKDEIIRKGEMNGKK